MPLWEIETVKDVLAFQEARINTSADQPSVPSLGRITNVAAPIQWNV